MVSTVLSKMGMTELIFVDPEMKVNDQYYRDVLNSVYTIQPVVKPVVIPV